LARLDRLQRRHRWLAIPYAVMKKFGEDRAGQLAALIAYYGFFSLFPLLLAFVSVVGFVLSGHPDLQSKLLDSALAQFPVIGDQLKHNVGELKGSTVGLVAGLVGLVWAGLGAMQAAETALDEVWDVPIKERPNFLIAKLRAVGMLLTLGLGIVLTTALATASTVSRSLGIVGTLVGGLMSLLVTIALFIASFKILTNRPLSWRQLIPGAVVGAIGWTAVQLIGGWYIDNHVRGANEVYGTFAVVIGLLSWLYLLAQVFVFAAEVNVVVSERLWPRSLVGDDLTDADRRALRRYARVEERLDDEDVEARLPSGREGDTSGRDGDTSGREGDTSGREGDTSSSASGEPSATSSAPQPAQPVAPGAHGVSRESVPQRAGQPAKRGATTMAGFGIALAGFAVALVRLMGHVLLRAVGRGLRSRAGGLVPLKHDLAQPRE
jgi:YihY family inner membrane protein